MIYRYLIDIVMDLYHNYHCSHNKEKHEHKACTSYDMVYLVLWYVSPLVTTKKNVVHEPINIKTHTFMWCAILLISQSAWHPWWTKNAPWECCFVGEWTQNCRIKQQYATKYNESGCNLEIKWVITKLVTKCNAF